MMRMMMVVVVINVCSRVGEEGNKTLLIVPHGIISLATSQYQMDSFNRENHKKWPPDESCPVGVCGKEVKRIPRRGGNQLPDLLGKFICPDNPFQPQIPLEPKPPGRAHGMEVEEGETKAHNLYGPRQLPYRGETERERQLNRSNGRG
jgi:hypothetical protein